MRTVPVFCEKCKCIMLRMNAKVCKKTKTKFLCKICIKCLTIGENACIIITCVMVICISAPFHDQYYERRCINAYL